MGVPTVPCDYFLKGNFPIEREILNMLDVGQKPVPSIPSPSKVYNRKENVHVPTVPYIILITQLWSSTGFHRAIGTPL